MTVARSGDSKHGIGRPPTSSMRPSWARWWSEAISGVGIGLRTIGAAVNAKCHPGRILRGRFIERDLDDRPTPRRSPLGDAARIGGARRRRAPRSRCASWPWRCWPRATCSSRTCRASARRCSPRRSRDRSGLGFARVQGTPDLLPTDVTGSSILRRQRSASSPARSSRTWCWSTRSTAPRREPSPRCSRRCRSARCRVDGETRPLPDAVRGARDPEPDRARGHVRAARGAARPLPGPGRARLPDRGRGAPDRAPLSRRAREPLDAIEPWSMPASCPRCASAVADACRSATRSRATSCASSAPRASTPTSSSARARAPACALYRAAQAWALLDGRDFVLPDDVAARRAGPDPPARARPRPRAARRHRRRRAGRDLRAGVGGRGIRRALSDRR